MSIPSNIRYQILGKTLAELKRGTGAFPFQPYPVALEPPWEPFDRNTATLYDCYANGWSGDYTGNLIYDTPGRPLDFRLLPHRSAGQKLYTIHVATYSGDEDPIWRSSQFLSALHVDHPIAFELTGNGDMVRVSFTCRGEDTSQVVGALHGYYPNAAVQVEAKAQSLKFPMDGAYLVPTAGFLFPLADVKYLNPDPLQTAVAALERLTPGEWGIIQILFQRAAKPWRRFPLPDREELKWAVPAHPDLFGVLAELTDTVVRTKFSSPLFAVSLRVAASRRSVLAGLHGWAKHFDAPPQALEVAGEPLEDEDETTIPATRWLRDDMEHRTTHRPGMILNLGELSGLVHLPAHALASDKLQRVKTRTQPAPVAKPGVSIGTNTHRGNETPAYITDELRLQHCYITGASGTGKSTLLLNLICQDLEDGHGVAVLDPHGDLIDDILPRIPSHRHADVILFDAMDTEYPVGLNILDSGSKERDRVVSETVAMIHRFYPDSWGPRLEHVLTHALLTMAQFKGKTLLDVRKLLTDDAFRARAIAALPPGDLKDFWLTEYPRLPQDAADPILNKLGKFLGNAVTKNIVAQPTSLDFDRIMNGRKVLLCKLSAGGVGEGVMTVLGTFIVTKLLNAALRRVAVPYDKRVPFYFYVDEFQRFANLSTVRFDTILVEARKYKLALTLANQYLSQVPADIREALYGAGTLITFRVGVKDAETAAKQFGIFTADEVLNQERGYALVRPEVASKTFNLKTKPKPPLLVADPMDIVRLSRASYAKTRAEVEAMFLPPQPAPQATASISPTPAPPPPAKQQRKQKPKSPRPSPMESGDGSLDEFVS